MAVKLNKHDLEFILKQIKIAEAHVAGTPLDRQIAQPHLPYGLRAVDGSYDDTDPGRELWGASDQIMPRVLHAEFSNEGDEGPESTSTGHDPGRQYHRRRNYKTPATWFQLRPRIITNLISDRRR